ncbi:maleylpyruvate isomerase N-terminal domain-containing protein [Algoriphagus hitonicola]|uniref:Mycothiol maleylpyruvate isomerase N-terminal domain-containing protein n=1 Tax=Algoriphagus hitonicola TaxID=435880 RepID=A0A1I2XIH8_9BACT|nr:maleylpyruvate isomerase N-terminal domain-containing protein [Algoriphagus hitonicola]SFH13298.1 Mycothiol maleylpyruvate isomerase N-terminal domain-containing protein [Algoriphagus hitonicola]
MNQSIPIRTIHLFEPLDNLLLEKLKEIEPKDWNLPTRAGSWTIKQIAAHLLDGNLRALSMLRDGYFGESPGEINSYSDLVGFLNRLNADWVKATQRLSPAVLISLLESSGMEYRNLLKSLKPFEKAVFSVAWAGEEESLNWFHVAREYTEKWHHTQQLLEALDQSDRRLLAKEFYLPYLETSMRALPHHFASLVAVDQTLIQVELKGEFSAIWWLNKTEDKWGLLPFSKQKPTSILTVSDDLAWKIFTKGISQEEAFKQLGFTGEGIFARHFVKMIAVMG